MAFGERLQREREMRGITLDEIAKATKIGTRSLRALEEEDFRKLPGGIFNKGFVRAYARYVGIDEEQAVTDYLAALGEPHDPALDSERLKKLEVNWKPPRQENLGSLAGRSLPWKKIVVLVVLAVIVVLGWHYRHNIGQRWQQWRARHHSANTVQMQVARPTGVESAPAKPVANPSPAEVVLPAGANTSIPATTSSPADLSSSDSLPADKGSTNGIVLQIRAREASWISVESDGTRVIREVLAARDERTVRAQKRLKLTAGNAGGVELRLNGKLLPTLGEHKEMRTVTFTPEGMESPPVRAE